jgi:Domain of unknown function (DUF3943)
MKTTCLLVFFFLFSTLLKAQHIGIDEKMSLNQHSGTTHHTYFNEFKLELDSNSKSDTVKLLQIDNFNDTSKHNLYGDLLNDDPHYNKKYHLWIPIAEVPLINGVIWSFGRYVSKLPYDVIGFNSIVNNFKEGWNWDDGTFQMKFFNHPYQGNMNFNAARSNGYNYFQSYLFAFGGSLMWEQIMENDQPDPNDLYTTSVSGAFIGETLYRISSLFLDDRITGSARVIREFLAGIIDPVRAFNRLLQGKMGRVTSKEVYQKEPLDITLYAGMNNVNDGANFWKGTNSAMVDISLAYGNPYEKRFRKPFDYFSGRADISIGRGSKWLDNLIGFGILYGKNFEFKNQAMLIGLFQHYDYWDSKSFELGASAFSAGITHKINLTKNSNIESQINIGIIPLAGLNSPYVQLEERTYDFSYGINGKFESTLDVGGFVSLTASYYFYGLHTYGAAGAAGNNIVGIFRPRIAINVFKNLNIGFEYLLYTKNSLLRDFPNLHSNNSEERVYISISSGYFRF